MPAVIPIALGAAAGGASAAIAGTSILTGTLVAGGLSGLQALLTERQRTVGTQRDDVRRREAPQLAERPAWWAIGRTRLQGFEVFPRATSDSETWEHRAYVLSHGSIDGLERVYLDGVPCDLVPFPGLPGAFAGRTGQITYREFDGTQVTENLAQAVTAYPYLEADGLGGASLRPVSGGRWTEAHQLHGVSWVHLRLPAELQPRKVEFVVRGLKMRIPGLAGTHWTDSAAAVRFWWLTERRGVPASDISRDSFLRAHGICSEAVRYSLPDALLAYPAAERRYTVNGIIHADDDPETVEAELDYAWGGAVAVADGYWTFHPGAPSPVRAVIPEGEIVAFESVQTSPAWERRMNGIRQSLAQEAAHEWVEMAMPVQFDPDARAADGRDLVTDLRQRAFTTSALAAGRIGQLLLRREVRMRRQWTVRIRPGDRLQRTGLRPGDVVRIGAADYGLRGQSLVVQACTMQPDASTSILVRPEIPYGYRFVAPPVPPGRAAPASGAFSPPEDDPIGGEDGGGDYYAI